MQVHMNCSHEGSSKLVELDTGTLDRARVVTTLLLLQTVPLPKLGAFMLASKCGYLRFSSHLQLGQIHQR